MNRHVNWTVILRTKELSVTLLECSRTALTLSPSLQFIPLPFLSSPHRISQRSWPSGPAPSMQLDLYTFLASSCAFYVLLSCCIKSALRTLASFCDLQFTSVPSRDDYCYYSIATLAYCIATECWWRVPYGHHWWISKSPSLPGFSSLQIQSKRASCSRKLRRRRVDRGADSTEKMNIAAFDSFLDLQKHWMGWRECWHGRAMGHPSTLPTYLLEDSNEVVDCIQRFWYLMSKPNFSISSNFPSFAILSGISPLFRKTYSVVHHSFKEKPQTFPALKTGFLFQRIGILSSLTHSQNEFVWFQNYIGSRVNVFSNPTYFLACHLQDDIPSQPSLLHKLHGLSCNVAPES